MFTPIKPLISLCAFGAVFLTSANAAAPINLLFIMTDQHRYDAMSCAGSPVVKTPRLDQLAAQGVRFSNAYCIVPICGPSRTSMLTGRTPEQTGVTGNSEVDNETLPRQMTFERVLMANGRTGEYHGKYHSPYNYTRDDAGKSYFARYVQWLNGPGPLVTPPGTTSFDDAYSAFLDLNIPCKQLVDGQMIANNIERPYWPDIADERYALRNDKPTRDAANLLIAKGDVNKVVTSEQDLCYGKLDLLAQHSKTTYTVDQGLAALERLKGAPFTLTISIPAPHPPMVLTPPYFGMYPASSIPTSSSIHDPLTGSPYLPPKKINNDEVEMAQISSDYFGLLNEVDGQIGRVLDRLDTLGLASNTMVIYTSDHGELLGDHGMYSKMVFYEGAVHVPLIIRLPSAIAAGKVINAPVSQIDLYATIVDYLSAPGAASSGASLRSLIDGTDNGLSRYAISYWDATGVPAYMVYDGRYKLMLGDGTSSIDAVYDLQSDPLEMTNLLRSTNNTVRAQALTQANRLRDLLVARLHANASTFESKVKNRVLTTGSVNQVPALTSAIVDTTWTTGGARTLTFPVGTFSDPDGDAITYTATYDGATLPAWLSFNSTTRTFSGTPPTNQVGKHTVRVMAKDASTGYCFDEFTLTVSTSTPTSPFATWQQQTFTASELSDSAISGALADPDKDSFSNLAEYALTLDPRASSLGSAVLPRMIPGAGGIYDFRFRRNSAATDVTYLIRSSTDLSSWTTQGTITGGTALPSAFGAGVNLIADPATQDITFRPASAVQKQFFRIEMTLTAP